jgi:hypothetical protein
VLKSTIDSLMDSFYKEAQNKQAEKDEATAKQQQGRPV